MGEDMPVSRAMPCGREHRAGGSIRALLMASRRMRALAAAVVCPLAVGAVPLPAGAAPVAPFQATALRDGDVPEAIRARSKDIVDAMQWTDAAGTHVVVLSQTGESEAKDGTRQARLHARHFLKSAAGEWQVRWQVMDKVEGCPLDLLCAFVKNSLALSDLDSDGVAEVSFVYRVDCFGGIDPIAQKLVVVHRDTKYLIRGRTVLFAPDGRRLDPEYFVLDEAFHRAPAALRPFAIQKWRRFQDHGLPHVGEP